MTRKGKRKIEGSHKLGEQIRNVRKEQGLSIVELSDKTGLSTSHLSEIETGKTTNPGVAVLQKIATALGISLSIEAGPRINPSETPLVLRAPFTLEELQKVGRFESQALQRIRNVIEDPDLSREKRKRIAEMLVSMGEWLRDEGKTERR